MISKLFRNNKGTRIAITVFVTLLLVAFCTSRSWGADQSYRPGRAVGGVAPMQPTAFPQTSHKSSLESRPSLNFGAGSTYVRGETPVIGLTINYPDKIGDIDYEMGLTLVGSSNSNPNNFGVFFRLVDGFGPVCIGFGLAGLQNTDQYNGSHVNFNLLLRWKFSDNFALDVNHWSNAGTVKPNKGRDMILFNYRF